MADFGKTDNNVKEDRVARVLYMFDRLQRGDGISKKEMANRFNVSSKSVQRDIDTIREYIFFNSVDAFIELDSTISYNKEKDEYFWENRNNMLLTEKEIAILSTILLESRSLPASDVERILKKMYIQCGHEEEKKIEALIKNELFNYVPPQHGKNPAELLYELIEAKRQSIITEIQYKKIGAEVYQKVLVKPLGIMFDQYYFYLMAENIGEEGKIIAYRIDRMKEIKSTDKHFKQNHAERFQEGKLRQEAHFMNLGERIKVKFRFWGKSLEAVLDRLPNARVLEKNENGAIVEAVVYGNGAKMWFLSQAEYLEILSPDEYREEMKNSIKKMLENYS